MNLRCVGVAIDQERHHFSGILCQVKPDHVFIEFLRLGCGDADRINACRHQDAIHHEAGRALVSIKEELLQGPEQEKGGGFLEGLLYLAFKRLQPTGKDAVQHAEAKSPKPGLWW